jgi:hypothetical protein
MVDLQPSQPERGVNKGREYMEQIRAHIGCIITCQAQSLSLIYVYQTNQFIVFDSHSREHDQKMQGACFLFFNSFVDVCCYLKNIFPPVDQPDVRMQSVEEQSQYAYLSVGQADFFCLGSSYKQSQQKEKYFTSPTQSRGVIPSQTRKYNKDMIPIIMEVNGKQTEDRSQTCEHCTRRNENKSLVCDTCQYPREMHTPIKSAFFKSKQGIIHYKYLATNLSQYNLGATSACTNMALQAVYECLNAIQGTEVPYGCTHTLLLKILEKGAEYLSRNHLDTLEVVRCRQELMNGGSNRLYQVTYYYFSCVTIH